MLKHRLALRFGRTIDELEASITGEEFFRWKAFNLIEPVGDNRLDILLSILCSVTANANGNKTDNEDFLVRWGEQSISQVVSSEQEEAQQMMAVMAAIRKRQEQMEAGPILVPEKATSQI